MEYKTSDINLIWKHAPKDFKGTLGGHKSIMVYLNGTSIIAIKDLPKGLFEQELNTAKRKEERANNAELLCGLYDKFGLKHVFDSTEQWRSSLCDVIQFSEMAFGENKVGLEQFRLSLEALPLTFEYS